MKWWNYVKLKHISNVRWYLNNLLNNIIALKTTNKITTTTKISSALILKYVKNFISFCFCCCWNSFWTIPMCTTLFFSLCLIKMSSDTINHEWAISSRVIVASLECHTHAQVRHFLCRYGNSDNNNKNLN